MGETLGTFEGRDVLQVRCKLTGAATGLNEALSVAPITHEHGEEVCLVVRGHVKVGFDDIKDTDCLARVENVVITSAAYVDEALVTEVLEAQEKMVEEAHGIARLPLALVKDHENGEHEGQYLADCPACTAP